jgi:hypothetical protein
MIPAFSVVIVTHRKILTDLMRCAQGIERVINRSVIYTQE